MNAYKGTCWDCRHSKEVKLHEITQYQEWGGARKCMRSGEISGCLSLSNVDKDGNPVPKPDCWE